VGAGTGVQGNPGEAIQAQEAKGAASQPLGHHSACLVPTQPAWRKMMFKVESKYCVEHGSFEVPPWINVCHKVTNTHRNGGLDGIMNNDCELVEVVAFRKDQVIDEEKVEEDWSTLSVPFVTVARRFVTYWEEV
jgi:hypothetical protein